GAVVPQLASQHEPVHLPWGGMQDGSALASAATAVSRVSLVHRACSFRVRGDARAVRALPGRLRWRRARELAGSVQDEDEPRARRTRGGWTQTARERRQRRKQQTEEDQRESARAAGGRKR